VVVLTTVASKLVGFTTELMRGRYHDGRRSELDDGWRCRLRSCVTGFLEDLVREAVVLVARELIKGEISPEIGAELGEVAPDQRAMHRNGYRPRAWETRVGEIELLVPRKRPVRRTFRRFLKARRPAEQAIVAVVMKAHVNGVLTRKVDRLVEQLDRRDDQGPRLGDLPRPRRTGCGVSEAAA